MKNALLLLVGAGAMSLFCVSAPAQTANSSSDGAASYVKVIRNATDASLAEDAYTMGITANRRSIPLHEAFIRRMVDLGAPEKAYWPAQVLLGLDPQNPYALSLVACGEAQRGNPTEAIKDIQAALQKLPGDPFVLRTAAQLAAWFDSEADPAFLPDAVKKAVAKIKQDLAVSPAFANAYKAAMAAYAQLAAGKPQAPAANPAGQQPPPAPPANNPQPQPIIVVNNNWFPDAGFGSYSYTPWGWNDRRRGCEDGPSRGVIVRNDGPPLRLTEGDTTLYQFGKPVIVARGHDETRDGDRGRNQPERTAVPARAAEPVREVTRISAGGRFAPAVPTLTSTDPLATDADVTTGTTGYSSSGGYTSKVSAPAASPAPVVSSPPALSGGSTPADTPASSGRGHR